MAEVVRYYENGEWKYATVKDVGDLNKLKTIAKEDLVSAINELYSTGGTGEVDAETLQRIKDLEELAESHGIQLGEQDSSLDKVQVDIIDIEEIQRQLEAKQQEVINDVANKADLTYVDGELTKKIDSTVYQNEYDAIVSDLQDKVDLNKYQTEYNGIVDDLQDKVDNLTLDAVKGRVDTVETNINSLEGEISSKIGRTEFDDAVGVNKWVASQYQIDGTDLSVTPPSFPLINGKTATQIKEVDDSQFLLAYNNPSTITHYFTNVKLDVANTMNMIVEYESSLAVYLNGAKIYEYGSNGQSETSISLSLRAGWNTIEILHGITESSPLLDLGVKISSVVDKLTSVIGVGDKNETRLIHAETLIEQNAEEISFKASNTEVTNLGNRVSDTESQLSIMSDEISSKVEQEDFNAYSQRLTNAESNIIQNAESITQKVEKTEYNLLNDRVKSAESAITQNANEIDLRVSKDEFDGLEGRVQSAESSINANEQAINLKASKTELDNVTGRLSDAEASITAQAEQIELRVTKDEFDDLSIGFKNLLVESLITNGYINDSGEFVENNTDFTSDFIKVNPNESIAISTNGRSNTHRIALYDINKNFIGVLTESTKDTFIQTIPDNVEWIRYSSNNFASGYFKVENGNKVTEWTPAFEDIKGDLTSLSDRLDSAETSINQTAEEISLKADKATTYTKVEVDGQLGEVNLKISDANTAITQNAEQIKLKASSQDVYTKTESDNMLDGKANNGDLNALVERVSTAETEISQNSESITLKADSSDVYTKTESDGNVSKAVSDAKAEIKVTTDGILQNVSNLESTVNEQGTKISSHDSSIANLGDEISLKVSSEDYTGDKIASLINQTATTITIEASKINLNGAVTFSSFDGATQERITDVEEKANSLQGNINNAVTEIDTSGVTVEDGSFFLKDKYNGEKFSIIDKTNLLQDHSFELCRLATASSEYYGVYTIANESKDFWKKHGLPYLFVDFSFLSNSNSRLSTFGMKMAQVSKSGYLSQTMRFMEDENFVLSAYYKHPMGTGMTTGILVLEVQYLSFNGNVIDSVSEEFQDVSSTAKRGYFKFKTPPASDLTDVRNMRIIVRSTTDDGYVSVDGVQLVTGNYAVTYRDDNALWSLADSGFPVLNAGDVRADWVTADIFSAQEIGMEMISLRQNPNRETLNIETRSGVGDFGSRNSSYFHFDTDRPRFYMYKPLSIQGIDMTSSDTLWHGASYPVESTTITPKKKLSECRTGWALIWSDFDAGVGANNFHWVATFIPRRMGDSFYEGLGMYHAVPNHIDSIITKYIYITNSTIKGSSVNHESTKAKDVVLRYIYEI
ncbi:hypothetical protein RVS70_05675 [Virgibacillus sp. M23]|uniref:coiled-coil domain-containing protein n=1 Tax=Virgibacillus sp. M23 TaxID=3079030 RepID=UPI002A916D7A|nr:hypothetical protein [Virgibacillus sp. M23]MDY7043690.1 hypothetical protein [Virgibacillus sp. M23]